MNLLVELNNLTVDLLKPRLLMLNERNRPTRKAEIIDCIKSHLLSDRINDYWKLLTPLEQKAIAEAVHCWGGTFQVDAFYAKYGELPDSFSRDYRSHKYWMLFIYGRKIPDDMVAPLKKIAALPSKDHLAIIPEDEIVGRFSFEHCDHHNQRHNHELMQCRSMEQAAQHDLHAILRLADSGSLSVSAKTGVPGAAALKKIDQLLMGGDFYSQDDDRELKSYQGGSIRPIRAYAWPLLLQDGGLAKMDGNKLMLTRNGKKALQQPFEVSTKALYSRWRDKATQDELRRINLIKGQTSKGQVKRNGSERKTCLEGALINCPVGQWIGVDELFRYMHSLGLFDFDVCHKPWALYLCDAQYGSLGNAIEKVQERYLLTCLFEYIATLGMIDVAYATPYAARNDLRSLWGADDASFLSRYDGLCYIRLNALGSYVLGLSDSYEAPVIESEPLFQINDQLHITMKRQPEPAELQMLQQYCKPTTTKQWKLDGKLLLSAAVADSAMEGFEHFLNAMNDGPLPEKATQFLEEMRYRRGALNDRGAARLIYCADKHLARKLADDSTTGKYCLFVNINTLAVPEQSLAAFRKAVEKLGFPL